MNFFRRGQIKQSLTKTRESFLTKLTNLVLLDNDITEDFWTGLEETLVGADLGGETTIKLVDQLRARADAERTTSPKRAEALLKEELTRILQEAQPTKPLGPSGPVPSSGFRPFDLFKGQSAAQPAATKMPYVILVVGVNGSGKTTSIGKLAKMYKDQKRKVVIAAGDTFRAAAIEQLQIWGQRVGVDVVAHQPEADPGAVAFDAWQFAKAHNADVLIVDTAGRLQSKTNLMKELEKISRVLQKTDPTAPHETLLVLDAVTGQNGLAQAREFKKTVPLTGLVLTKLDGTAKGGIVFAIARDLKLPIRYIGTGEGLDDFAPFDPDEFVTDLFEE
ncbi:MAG: signal recognition particle-docking protein FtsY [Anaerolineae bacterium]